MAREELPQLMPRETHRLLCGVKAAALCAGRSRPTQADWIAVRVPNAGAFLAWWSEREDLLLTAHGRRDEIRRRKAIDTLKDGCFGPVDERVVA